MAAMTHDMRHDPAYGRAEDTRHESDAGMDFGAAFFGWLAAISIGALLTALLAALGGAVALASFDTAAEALNAADAVSFLGAIGLLIVAAISYYAGGYVAGRMSHADGTRQGFGVWLVGIIAVAVSALAGLLFGGAYNVLQQLNLPAIPVDGPSFTTGGLFTALGILIVSVLAALAGGKAGERYHHKIEVAGYGEGTEHERMVNRRLAHHH